MKKNYISPQLSLFSWTPEEILTSSAESFFYEPTDDYMDDFFI